jgi:hypothetical protein
VLGCLWLVVPLIATAVVMVVLRAREIGRNCPEPTWMPSRSTVPPVVWVTGVDGADHAVADEVMAATIAAGSGEYRAWCEAVVLPASMLVPPARQCSGCVSARAKLGVVSSGALVAAHRGVRPEGVL